MRYMGPMKNSAHVLASSGPFRGIEAQSSTHIRASLPGVAGRARRAKSSMAITSQGKSVATEVTQEDLDLIENLIDEAQIAPEAQSRIADGEGTHPIESF
jgi:hypothetical protein